MSWLTNAWNAITRFLYGTFAGAVIRNATGNVLRAAGQIGLDLLMAEAMDRTRFLDRMDSMSGEEKHINARTYLQGYAEREGIKVGISILNFIIESALQAMRAEKDDAI